LTSVEIDQRAIEVLTNQFTKDLFPNFSLSKGDIRDFNINTLLDSSDNSKLVKVIGNIPYNLSSDILFYLLRNNKHISKVILMLQKEVAQRINAKPRSKAYGILTVATELVATSKILFDVSPSCFIPKPAVTSAIIEITFKKDIDNIIDFDKIMPIIRMAFSQRRKVLRNSLSTYFGSMKLDPNNVQSYFEQKSFDVLHKRAEELTMDDFIKLYSLLQEIKPDEV
jgi:16S rRNA (adenine1518-N6/adenine1519-N6)-dimethyltransferase